MSKKKSPSTPRKIHQAWIVLGWTGGAIVFLGLAFWLAVIWLQPRMEEYRLSHTGKTALGRVDRLFKRIHHVQGTKFRVARDVEVEYVHVDYCVAQGGFVNRDGLKDGYFAPVTYLPEEPTTARLGPPKESLVQVAELDSFEGIIIAGMTLLAVLFIGGLGVLCGFVAFWETELRPSEPGKPTDRPSKSRKT